MTDTIETLQKKMEAAAAARLRGIVACGPASRTCAARMPPIRQHYAHDGLLSQKNLLPPFPITRPAAS